jgi:hypothetical protein
MIIGGPALPATIFIGEIATLSREPGPDLLVQIGWKAEHYEFAFFEAEVLMSDLPTSSWVEVAFSRQLGGALVLWRSGVPGLEMPRSISYGWIESAGIETVGRAIETKAATSGPALAGCIFNIKRYYENCTHDDCTSHPH